MNTVVDVGVMSIAIFNCLWFYTPEICHNYAEVIFVDGLFYFCKIMMAIEIVQSSQSVERGNRSNLAKPSRLPTI